MQPSSLQVRFRHLIFILMFFRCVFLSSAPWLLPSISSCEMKSGLSFWITLYFLFQNILSNLQHPPLLLSPLYWSTLTVGARCPVRPPLAHASIMWPDWPVKPTDLCICAQTLLGVSCSFKELKLWDFTCVLVLGGFSWKRKVIKAGVPGGSSSWRLWYPPDLFSHYRPTAPSLLTTEETNCGPPLQIRLVWCWLTATKCHDWVHLTLVHQILYNMYPNMWLRPMFICRSLLLMLFQPNVLKETRKIQDKITKLY